MRILIYIIGFGNCCTAGQGGKSGGLRNATASRRAPRTGGQPGAGQRHRGLSFQFGKADCWSGLFQHYGGALARDCLWWRSSSRNQRLHHLRGSHPARLQEWPAAIFFPHWWHDRQTVHRAGKGRPSTDAPIGPQIKLQRRTGLGSPFTACWNFPPVRGNSCPPRKSTKSPRQRSASITAYTILTLVERQRRAEARNKKQQANQGAPRPGGPPASP